MACYGLLTLGVWCRTQATSKAQAQLNLCAIGLMWAGGHMPSEYVGAAFEGRGNIAVQAAAIVGDDQL